MIGKIKTRLVNWLLKDIVLNELKVKRLVLGEKTINITGEYIDLPPLASDPPLSKGRIWFRDGKIKLSPDGVSIKQITDIDDLNTLINEFIKQISFTQFLFKNNKDYYDLDTDTNGDEFYFDKMLPQGTKIYLLRVITIVEEVPPESYAVYPCDFYFYPAPNYDRCVRHIFHFHQASTLVSYGGVRLENTTIFPYPLDLSEYQNGKWVFTNYGNKVSVSLLLKIFHDDFIEIGRYDRGVRETIGFAKLSEDINNSYVSYSSSLGSEEVVAEIDLQKVYTIKRFCVKLAYYISASASGSYVKVQYSTDGTSWTDLFNSGDLPTTETVKWITGDDFKARYIRYVINSASPSSTAYLKAWKNWIWVPKSEYKEYKE